MAKYDYWLTDDGLQLLAGWARSGLTDEQIAHNMGIAVSTLYEWKKRYSEISEVLKNNKEIADIAVENALYKRAIGYSYTETTKEDGKVIKTVEKEVVPDTTAQIFWLKNRQPERWRDKQEIQNSGNMDFNVTIKVVE
ncbi:helix-turn-helix domain-containing protein [Dielma fastidiosa]|uniref:Homeodomain-like domain-containing protein n=1 Tax=Dielma fastidiosa TaxID=1034346 RepID=A0A318KK55_9FIRM|nr:helix-turn-helix domain-containing protein [Dielma fastidiosa]PXX78464.1 Homeodomain-like domain-containing protein [Dielma fastidiosa]